MPINGNKELIRRWIATTDAQNFAAYDELLAADVVAHLPGGVDLGRQEVEEFERSFAVAFPDIRRTVEDLIAEGDKVVMRETVRGTHKRAFERIPATGREVQFGAIVIYRIVDAKIVET